MHVTERDNSSQVDLLGWEDQVQGSRARCMKLALQLSVSSAAYEGLLLYFITSSLGHAVSGTPRDKRSVGGV
jgi:hypothetical protein